MAARTVGFGAALLIVACGDQRGAIAATDPSQERRVSVANEDELTSALQSVRDGDTILLAPGNYSVLRIAGKKFARGITVTSADAARPAVVGGVVVQESSHATLKNLEVTLDPRTHLGVNIGGADGVRLEALDIHSVSGRDCIGVNMRNSKNVTLYKSDIHDVGVGIQHLDDEHISIASNKIHDLDGDGIKGGGSSYVAITGNQMTNFTVHPKDHPDAIQFWTVNTKTPTHDLIISNNVFVRGAGAPVQGIFLGNEADIPYQNVTVTGNAIVGGMYHGITIYGADGVRVSNNLVQGYSDMDSWIQLNHTTNSTLSGNSSTSYMYDNLANEKLVKRDNRKLSRANIGDVSALKNWPAAQQK
jgi:hypothetical protein